MLIGAFGGVCRMVTRLIDELSSDSSLEIVALCADRPYEPLADRPNVELITSSFTRWDRTAARRRGWEQRELPEVIRASRADVFHATWNSGVPQRGGVPTVLTIHDLIPWHDPAQYFATRRDRWSYRRAIRGSARRAAQIVTVSEWSLRDVSGTLGIAGKRISVIGNGVDAPGRCKSLESPSRRPYLLYVGGQEPRKNVAGLFRAMDMVWRRSAEPFELHLTGGAGHLCDSARAVYHQLLHPDRIRFLGTLDDNALSTAYASARAFVFLSTDEGFGLPPVEAMAHGCPVVAARRASLPEVTGNAAALVDPDDVSQVADSILCVLNCEATRRTMIERGRLRAAEFTWRRAADQYGSLYRQVVAQSRQGHERIVSLGAPGYSYS
jgi:glycosyltransferase involved in cell wall biosynthesis